MKQLVIQIFCFCILSFSTNGIEAQLISTADLKKLQQKEDSLSALTKNLLNDSATSGRMRSDSQFVRTFVRSLQIKNSFYYPFDSLQGISKIFSPDSSFKIFTWYLQYDDYYGRQRGFIQMRTKDGSLKGFPLRDNSEFTESPNTIVCRDTSWIGAVYYNIIKTQHLNKNYYTLFGYDYHSVRSNKKWIEVLTFGENGSPIFGGNFFNFQEDSLPKSPLHRYSIEYKKDANIFLNYVPELSKILQAHLVSETDEPQNAWTMIPDGDFEGFKWLNGKWIHIEKVNTDIEEEGDAPLTNQVVIDKKNLSKSSKSRK